MPIEDDAKAVVRLQAMGAPVAFARLPSWDHFDYRLVIAERQLGRVREDLELG